MKSFADLKLSPKILTAITNASYEVPTPIQEESIPYILQRMDILGIAQTGTGKTASFVLPILNFLEQKKSRARLPRFLILEPTRELATQVAESFQQFIVSPAPKISLLIGGVSFGQQEKILDKGVDIIIATPGRLLDHFKKGKLLLTGLELWVIDEADRMLDMGFMPDIEELSDIIPPRRQTLLFSATMPDEIQKLTNKFLLDPKIIEVAPISSTAKTIEQWLVQSEEKDWHKRKILRNILELEKEQIQNAVIFCNRKKDVITLFRSMSKHGYDAGTLHGDMEQSDRSTILKNFREGRLKYLIASDIAARGLDVPEVSHVFNFDVPLQAEDYVHRIGRTGRAGRAGKAFTIVTKSDEKYLKNIETIIEEKINWLQLNNDISDIKTQTIKPTETTEAIEKTNKKKRKKVAAINPSDTKKTTNNQNKIEKNKSENIILGFGDNIPAFMLIE
ncbi:DEAD/DEAH box helicase [Bartonella sp. DGB1]|uniref:DEAD/DEAH box helicase n=1 Tax=Bartonella sp. DGB1 TaxID=3239807 RepID=UPI00352376B8